MRIYDNTDRCMRREQPKYDRIQMKLVTDTQVSYLRFSSSSSTTFSLERKSKVARTDSWVSMRAPSTSEVGIFPEPLSTKRRHTCTRSLYMQSMLETDIDSGRGFPYMSDNQFQRNLSSVGHLISPTNMAISHILKLRKHHHFNLLRKESSYNKTQ